MGRTSISSPITIPLNLQKLVWIWRPNLFLSSPFTNQGLWIKIQRIQYRIIRTALELRQSTPICVLMSEACEPSMKIRLEMLTSRYIYKCLSRRFNLVTRSLRRLEIDSKQVSSPKRVLIKKIPTFKTYILQKRSWFDAPVGCSSVIQL